MNNIQKFLMMRDFKNISYETIFEEQLLILMELIQSKEIYFDFLKYSL